MFQHKDYVEAIYKEKNFGKAAEKLHVSQPALSAMIKRLEKELGAPIFNRKTSPISLTSFGAEYLKSASIVTDLEDRLKSMAYNENQLLSGELTLAGFNWASLLTPPVRLPNFSDYTPTSSSACKTTIRCTASR